MSTSPHLDDLAYGAHVSLAADEARTYAIQAEEYGDAIRDLYRQPYAGDRDKRVAALHQLQGEAMKFAEIHATLAVADAVQSLARLVDALLDVR